MAYRKYIKNTSKEGVVEKVNPVDSIANKLANIFIESLKEEKLPWSKGFTSSYHYSLVPGVNPGDKT